MRRLALLSCLLALAAPAAAQTGRPKPAKKPRAKVSVAFPTPAGWLKTPGATRFRFAQYRPRGGGPELVVFHFEGHGEVSANINRWLKQVEQPNGRPSTKAVARLTRWRRGGMVLHVVDLRGTRVPRRGHTRKGARLARRVPNWRLLGAVLECPGGPFFIRLEGPQAQLAKLERGFFELAFGARRKAPTAGRGKLVFTPQPGWRTERPRSRMRAAQFSLPGAKGAPRLRLVVYHFGRSRGGTVQANLTRWIGQLTQPDGRASKDVAKIRKHTLPNAIRLTVLDLSGTYVAPTSPGSRQRVNQPNQRLLAAVVECPQGPYFVKLIGPKASVDAQASAFMRFLRGLRAGP